MIVLALVVLVALVILSAEIYLAIRHGYARGNSSSTIDPETRRELS